MRLCNFQVNFIEAVRVICVTLICTAVLSPAMAQQLPASNAQFADTLTSNTVFVAWRNNPSVQQCGLCHYQPGNRFASRSTELYRMDELKQWLEKDKHAIARHRIEPVTIAEKPRVLKETQQRLSSSGEVQLPENWIGASNHLSAKICDELNFDIKTDLGYAKFRDSCLTCHGGYKQGEDDTSFARQCVNHPGISCKYCHQVNKTNAWIDAHSGVDSATEWRLLSPAVKEAQGMRHLSSLENQTQLCVQCHVGDIDKGMFVTHAMYAAGHPPLPALELQTLVEAMPRHWPTIQQLSEQAASKPQVRAYLLATFPDLNGTAVSKNRDWHTEAVSKSSLSAYRQSLQLMVRASQETSGPPNVWGDFALYDCAACHHDLQIDSVRQSQRTQGVPGRPRMLEWPVAVPQAVVTTSGQATEFRAAYQQLTRAMTKRPFGDQAAIHKAAKSMTSVLDKAALVSSSSDGSGSTSRQLLIALADTPAETVLDYQAARSLLWTIRSMAAHDSLLNSAVRAQIKELGTEIQPDQTRREFVATTIPIGFEQQIFPTHVQAELDRQAAYDARKFHAQLQSLAAALKDQ